MCGGGGGADLTDAEKNAAAVMEKEAAQVKKESEKVRAMPHALPMRGASAEGSVAPCESPGYRRHPIECDVQAGIARWGQGGRECADQGIAQAMMVHTFVCAPSAT